MMTPHAPARSTALGLASLGAICVLLALSACAIVPPSDTPSSQRASMPVQTLRSADAGKTITLAPGNKYAVELLGIPTAGYVWSVTSKPDFVTLLSTDTRSQDPKARAKGMTGGNDWFTFVFEVNKVGSGELTLEHARPWEREAGQPPDETFSVRIVAQ